VPGLALPLAVEVVGHQVDEVQVTATNTRIVKRTQSLPLTLCGNGLQTFQYSADSHNYLCHKTNVLGAANSELQRR
jgi:hypothetical protein